MDQSRHRGTTAIVTGAGSGIGQATVLRMAQEGAQVIGCDVSREGLDETRVALGSHDLDATLLTADVTNQSDVDQVVQAADGRVDVLANVAGVMDHFVPLGELTDDLWERVLAINLTGVMRLTRAVLPLMQQASRGAIVTVGSEASVSAGESGVSYTASKHAVVGLVKHVAFFYGPSGVRSNAVLPGGVSTGIGATSDPRSDWAYERAKLSMATMPPLADADEIAAVISWLASQEASFVNGAALLVDGGWGTT